MVRKKEEDYPFHMASRGSLFYKIDHGKLISSPYFCGLKKVQKVKEVQGV
jgi:hypothetical protein